MPNRSVHQSRAILPGGIVAAYKARNEKPFNVLLETFGGAFSARFGAILPDVFDCPTSPNHRSLGHGIVPTLVGGDGYLAKVDQWQQWLRSVADSHALARKGAEGFEWLYHLGVEILFRVLSGAVVGFPVGFLSHLVLDSQTTKGLPFLF